MREQMLFICLLPYLFYSDGALADPVVGGGEVVVHEVGRVLVSAGSTRELQATFIKYCYRNAEMDIG